MVYDWNGQKTRRLNLIRLATAVAFGLAVPLAITAWSYVR
jgi:hypothetical protein